LARADGRGPRGDLGPADLRAFCQDSPRLLLDRDAAVTRLQTQALNHFVIQVSDDDRRHGGDIISGHHRYHNVIPAHLGVRS
jgi:hypothetical protein